MKARHLAAAAVLFAMTFAVAPSQAEPITAGQCGGVSVVHAGDTSDSFSFTACTPLGVRPASVRNAVTSISWTISSPRGSLTCNWGAAGDPVCSGPSASGRWIPAQPGDTVNVSISTTGCTGNCAVAFAVLERVDA